MYIYLNVVTDFFTWFSDKIESIFSFISNILTTIRLMFEYLTSVLSHIVNMFGAFPIIFIVLFIGGLIFLILKFVVGR